MTITPDDFADAKWDATAHAREVLEHLHKALAAVPAFTLKDGTAAQVDEYYPPTIDDEGELSCGVDVHLNDGTDLEFTVRNSGWGKAILANMIEAKEEGTATAVILHSKIV